MSQPRTPTLASGPRLAAARVESKSVSKLKTGTLLRAGRYISESKHRDEQVVSRDRPVGLIGSSTGGHLQFDSLRARVRFLLLSAFRRPASEKGFGGELLQFPVALSGPGSEAPFLEALQQPALPAGLQHGRLAGSEICGTAVADPGQLGIPRAQVETELA